MTYACPDVTPALAALTKSVDALREAGSRSTLPDVSGYLPSLDLVERVLMFGGIFALGVAVVVLYQKYVPGLLARLGKGTKSVRASVSKAESAVSKAESAVQTIVSKV
jgi:hypothetical protein